MPSISKRDFKHIQVKELHPTFAAEIEGVDFENISDDVFADILAASAKYGVIVFRSTGMNDTAHVSFSRRFGELDDIRPYMTNGRKPRYEYYELFDASNIDAETNAPLNPSSPRAQYNKGNSLFHVDSSFNPRRASFSILKAHALPPSDTGGNTDFADTRTAFDDLPSDLKAQLLTNDYIGAHSLHHSRKTAAPDYFADVDPTQHTMHRHRLIQPHEPSERMNLYIAAHLHHIDGLPPASSAALIKRLMEHATQEKYLVSIPWINVGDLVIWDNRAVMHRAGKGTFQGTYVRDLRRTTVHDDGREAWGLNKGGERGGFEMPGA